MQGPKIKQTVLFLCTGNSCRSQIAEGLLRHLAGERSEAASAGTHPAGLNPGAVAAMQEIGIDISSHRSKGVDEYRDARFDYVITVCDRAKETCPIFPASSVQLHWSFEDPATAQGAAAERQAVFRRVREQIAERMRRFIQSGA